MKKSPWARAISLALAALLIVVAFAACSSTATTTTAAPTTTGANGETAAPTTAAAETVGSFPRNETLYYGGQQWNPIAGYHPFHANNNNWLITVDTGYARVVVYETLFMYNNLDGKLHGLLGESYTLDVASRELTVTLKKDAHWSDGTPFTAKDVEFTFALSQKYTSTAVSARWDYLESVVATDDYTVVFTGSADNFAPKMMEFIISSNYIVPEHIWSQVDADAAGDNAKFLETDARDFPASGPYKWYNDDDTKVSVIRDDNYWGQSASMWGKLPAPKYLVHSLYKDNNAVENALRAGQIDVDQQFLPQVWKLWEGGAPVSTYLSESPYFIPGQIPSIFFNMSVPALQDVAVRKALAMAIDYNAISQNAMSGYSAPMNPSLFLPVESMQALADMEALKSYQWTGNQIDEANALLDEAGWVKGSDGIREKDGVKLSFQLVCPQGWTDWNATLEIVSQSGKAIGMDAQTFFPEFAVYLPAFYAGEYDVGMWALRVGDISAPWSTARMAMLSKGNADFGQTATYNFGRYENARADELIAAIGLETDTSKTKDMWTELNQIYLTDVPSIGLMYRPNMFHIVSSSTWDGFPQENDGSNIPPLCLTDGYGIAGLYNIYAK